MTPDLEKRVVFLVIMDVIFMTTTEKYLRPYF